MCQNANQTPGYVLNFAIIRVPQFLIIYELFTYVPTYLLIYEPIFKANITPR